MNTLPLVSDEQARSVVTVDDALNVVEQTYADLGAGRLALSDPEVTRLGDDTRGFALKAAILDRYGVAGIRVLPTHTGGRNGWCLVLESASGRPLVGVAEAWLHRLRTAASAVVAARLLARPDSRVLTLVGAGRIAELVPAAFAAAFPGMELRVVARRAESAAALATPFGGTFSTSLDEAAPGSDVIISITSAIEPIVHARHLALGGTVIGLGGGPEIAAETLSSADQLFVDELAYAQEVGSVAGWLRTGLTRADLADRLTADLPAVITGQAKGRVSDDDRVLAVVQGVAACDVALACLVAERLGVT